MYIPFNQMNTDARIWIYQANRTLTADEKQVISSRSQTFLEQWQSHSLPLKCSFKILYNRFLIISVDEKYQVASGCSIDSSVTLIRDLSISLKIDFMDKSKVCFFIENQIIELPLSEIKQNVVSNKIQYSTLTFNNLVPDIVSLQNKWLVPVADSWLKKYF